MQLLFFLKCLPDKENCEVMILSLADVSTDEYLFIFHFLIQEVNMSIWTTKQLLDYLVIGKMVG